MKILRTEKNGPVSKIVLIELTPEDKGRSEAEIITATDRQGEYTWDGKSHPCHFGGSVVRVSGKKGTCQGQARVTIWID